MATRDIEEGELIVCEEPALVLGPTEKRGASIGDNVCCVSEQAYEDANYKSFHVMKNFKEYTMFSCYPSCHPH